MDKLIIYAHLAVILFISMEFINVEDYKVVRAIGAIGGLWATILAYIYAVYQIYTLLIK